VVFNISIETRSSAQMETTMHFLLFYKIELTDRYPVTTLICGASTTVLMLCIGKAWGIL
jgi:hypothetical protein